MLHLFHPTTTTPENNPHYTVLLDDLERTKRELEHVYSAFSNVTDPDLIDSYIYEVNAIMKRYRYLLQRAAEQSPLPQEKLSESYCTSVF